MISIYAVLSALVTPFIVFITTANHLFLKNQVELYHDLSLYIPYLIAFLLFWLIGVGLHLVKTKTTRVLLWLFLFTGPWVLISVYLPSMVSLLLLFVLILSSIILRRQPVKGTVAQFFSVLAILFLTTESHTFFSQYKHREPVSKLESASIKSGLPDQSRPNIYHIVLDEFQTDMFELTLTDDIEEQLADFYYFPNNITTYGRTGMSLASIFQSKKFDYDSSQKEFQYDALNSDKSFLFWLKKAGYETFAVLHQGVYDGIEYGLFDFKVYSGDLATLSPPHETFYQLWIYSNFNKLIGKMILDTEFLEQVETQSILVKTAPVISYLSFKEFLKFEKGLSDANRYTFLHLMIPHFPYVLDSDCTYGSNTDYTRPIEQTNCATKLILEFVQSLKKLKRFKKSFIVIHGDHGASFILVDGKLVVARGFESMSEEWNRARSRAMLLIKPPAESKPQQFKKIDFNSELIDIMPTVFHSVGLEMPNTFEGVPLVSPTPDLHRPTRYFHMYKKLGANELTDCFQRFVIHGDKITKEKIIVLEKNLPSVSADPEQYKLIGHGAEIEQIIPKNNDPIVIEKEALKGYFRLTKSEISVFANGWAANMEKPGAIPKLLVFINKEFRCEGKVQFQRKDVVRVLKDEMFLVSGFSFNIPHIKPDDIEGLDIQVFAYDEKTRKASRLIKLSPGE